MCKPFIHPATWLVMAIFVLCHQADGQNLVPNASFEDVNTCSEFEQPCSPSAWFYLSRKLTTGYFPLYPSATGKRHLAIVAASRETPNRQYWQTQLLCDLQAGEKYIVSMKIAAPASRTELSPHAPNLRDIGLWFTTRYVFVQGDSVLQPRSYLSFTGAAVKDLKNGWFEIKKEFTPGSAASVCILGNFNRSANADIMEQRNWPAATIDVLVDDLSVVPVRGGLCRDAQKVKDYLYSILLRHSDILPQVYPPAIPDAQPPTKDHTPDSLTRGNPSTPARVPPTSIPALKTDTIVMYNIQFDFDKYTMQNPDTLERYRRLLTRPGIKKMEVVGFTDDIGSEAYNKDLSEKRARSIASLLSSKFQIPAAIIEAGGRGISRKYATKDLNRRVEIYIFHE